MCELFFNLALEQIAAVLIHEVPLVVSDHKCPTGVENHAQHALILLGNLLGGIDQEDHNLGIVNRRTSTQRGVELVALGGLGLLADTRGVHEAPQRLVHLHQRVHRVNRGTGHVADHCTIFTGELVQQRGLAHIRLAHQRYATRPGRQRLRTRHLREGGHHFVHHVGIATAVEGRGWVRLTEPEGPELRDVAKLRIRLELVGGEDNRLLRALQTAGHDLFRGGDADGGVNDHDNHIGGLHGGLRLTSNRRMHALGVRIPAAGVLHPEATSAPFTQVGDAVAGHAREVFDNCFTTANEPVNHGGLTNIRSSHNGHGRKSFFLLVAHAKCCECVFQLFPVGVIVNLAGFGALDGFGDDRLVVSNRAVDELVCAGVASCGARRVFALHVCNQVPGGVVVSVIGVLGAVSVLEVAVVVLVVLGILGALVRALELLVVDIVPVHGGPRVAGLNNIEDVFHDLFDVHLRGVQNDCVFGGLQRRGRTAAVEFVAADDVGKHGVEVSLATSGDVLVVAAAGAHLGGGGHEDFRRNVREHNRADVAAFHHTAHSRCGQRALECDQVGAHRRNRGDRRHVAGDLRAANLAGDILAVEEDGGGVRVIGDF